MPELLEAIKAGDAEQASALLDLGSQKPAEVTAALICAGETGQVEVLNVLLGKVADQVNSQASNGNYPLRAAIVSGDYPCVQALLLQGADPNKETVRGTPLLCACQSEGAVELVSLLLDHGANVNYETKDGSTPLKAAVRENKRELCQALLKRGADPGLKPDGSASALEIAQEKVLPDIYSLLIQQTITSSAEQALIDSERRQREARLELEQTMAAEQAKLQQSAAVDKDEVAAKVQALRSENEEMMAKYNFTRKK